MNCANLILDLNPQVKFELKENGFQIIDSGSEENSGFYLYKNVESVDLNNSWFPSFSNWIRIVTCLFNVVPFFPDADTCKKSSLFFRYKDKGFGFWITNVSMVEEAKQIKAFIEQKMTSDLK